MPSLQNNEHLWRLSQIRERHTCPLPTNVNYVSPQLPASQNFVKRNVKEDEREDRGEGGGGESGEEGDFVDGFMGTQKSRSAWGPCPRSPYSLVWPSSLPSSSSLPSCLVTLQATWYTNGTLAARCDSSVPLEAESELERGGEEVGRDGDKDRGDGVYEDVRKKGRGERNGRAYRQDHDIVYTSVITYSTSMMDQSRSQQLVYSSPVELDQNEDQFLIVKCELKYEDAKRKLSGRGEEKEGGAEAIAHAEVDVEKEEEREAIVNDLGDFSYVKQGSHEGKGNRERVDNIPRLRSSYPTRKLQSSSSPTLSSSSSSSLLSSPSLPSSSLSSHSLLTPSSSSSSSSSLLSSDPVYEDSLGRDRKLMEVKGKRSLAPPVSILSTQLVLIRPKQLSESKREDSSSTSSSPSSPSSSSSSSSSSFSSSSTSSSSSSSSSPPPQQLPNILVLLIPGLSAAHFQRMLPMTYKYLKQHQPNNLNQYYTFRRSVFQDGKRNGNVRNDVDGSRKEVALTKRSSASTFMSFEFEKYNIISHEAIGNQVSRSG